MPERSLECPSCKTSLGIAALFDNCTGCVPNERFLSFICPKCNDQMLEIRFEDQYLLIGGPNGFPEPGFWESGRVLAKGITVRWEPFNAKVSYRGNAWTFGVSHYYREYCAPKYSVSLLQRFRESLGLKKRS